jgi:signal peptide peptidase SppA
MDWKTIEAAFYRWLAYLPVRKFRDPAPLVNVLRLSGVIGRIGPVGGGLTLAGHERAIERAFRGRNLVTVALAVNSPGGSPVQSALIARRIREIAGEKQIPVVAFAEDVAASGGYWLACAADEIFADRNSIIGSIGVISAGFGFAQTIRRLGIERRVHTAGSRKGMFDPFRDERPEDIARLVSIQGDVHESFKDMVRARRGERLQGTDEELFEGDVWTGNQALSLGLIDGLGDLRTVMRERFGERVKLRPIVPRSGVLRRPLTGAPAESRAAGHVAAALAAIDEWWHWKRFGL